MKKMSKLLALIIAAAMIIMLLAACGSSTETAAETEEPAAEETAEPAEETAEEPAEEPAEEAAEETEPAEEAEEENEIAEIEIYLMGGTNQDDGDKVTEAINAITEEAIGVRAHFTFLTGMEYPNGLSMAIAGGEEVDICTICPLATGAYSILQSSGQLMDISGLLDEYGQDLLGLVGDYLGAFTIDGAVYGVPTLRDMHSSMYLIVRTDVMEELGTLDAIQNAQSFTDIGNVFQSIVDNTDLYAAGYQNNVMTCAGYLIGEDNFADCSSYDYIDSLYAVIADDEGNISNLYTSDDYVNMIKRVAEWNEAGYIYPDSLMTEDTSTNLIKNGVEAAGFMSGEIGIDASQSSRTGYPITAVKIVDGVLGAGSIVKWGAGVPVTAQEPEAAVKFLNLLYTNEELMNLIGFGIEDEHYTVTDGVANYPDGISADNTTYHFGEIFGNTFIMLPWNESSDYRQISEEDNAAAKLSYYVSMSFDTSDLTNEIANISAVQAEYCNPFNVGLYTEETYQEFLDKLTEAGIDNYIASYQQQVDDQKG